MAPLPFVYAAAPLALESADCRCCNLFLLPLAVWVEFVCCGRLLKIAWSGGELGRKSGMGLEAVC